MEIKFDVKMTVNAMYNFMLYHNYTRFSGILGVCLGVAAFIIGVATFDKVDTGVTFMYFIFGVLFLFFTPISLYTKAKRQVEKTPMFQEPITYIFNSNGIVTVQGDLHAELKWDELYKIAGSRKSLIVYVTRVRAFVLPKECIGDQLDAVTEMIVKYMPVRKVKIRG